MNRRALLRTLALSPLLASAIARAWQSAVAVSFGKLPKADAVRRVLAAGPPSAVLVYVLAPDMLVGWPWALSDEALVMLPQAHRELPQTGRLVGRGGGLGTEALLALQPDLILDAGTVDPTHVSGLERVWQQTGVPCVLVDGRLVDHATQLSEAGQLLGVASRGEMLASEARRILDLAEDVLAKVTIDERPRVYCGRGMDGLETGLERSINMEAVEFAGGRNVAAQAGRGSLTQASMEQLLDWNPEVILSQNAAFTQRVLHDPLWKNISAVRHGRVHLAPSLPFGWLDGPPGVNRLIGVRWLLSILYPGRHPELSEDRTMQAAIEFHRSFYGAIITRATLDTLMGKTA